MNKLNVILIIIVFLIKTGNVFSSESIFNVDNIVVNKEMYKKDKDLLNFAFKEGFNKLTEKILKTNDLKKISNIELDQIRELISHYRIIQNEELGKENEVKVNLSFNREKINKYFFSKNISYADISKTKIVVLPIFFKENKLFIYSENYFYKNWNNEDQLEKSKFIEYILPVESIDDIQYINNNTNNLESLKISNLLSSYEIDDYVFLIIKNSNERFDIFLKGKVSGSEIIKNITFFNNEKDEKKRFNYIIYETKRTIDDIWKSKNLIDLRTPSFLNFSLNLKKPDDLLKLKRALTQIDLIENFSVIELNKNYAKMKIKYLGKIDKIKKKLNEQGIKILILDEVWTLELV